MSDTLIKVEGVSKKFCRSLKKSLWYGMQDLGREITGQRHGGNGELRPDEFWAINDVSFELKRGECLGLIGHNGAGKTTLLKMLNGLIKPDKGYIEMRGRVGALIALGAGFNPILSGRENIYVNGSVLGLTKREIDEKIDDIIDFSEIRDFIDAPVQTYSSGMQVRLGFAVTTAMSPDILLVDEVLAVGDINFRVRCYNRLRDMLPSTAIIIVSHNMFDITKLCSEVVTMDHGKNIYYGETTRGIQIYNKLAPRFTSDLLEYVEDGTIRNVKIISSRIENKISSANVEVKISLESMMRRDSVRIRCVFFDQTETPIAEWDSFDHEIKEKLDFGDNLLSIYINNIRLISGSYRLVIVVTDDGAIGYYLRIDRGLVIDFETRHSSGSPYRI